MSKLHTAQNVMMPDMGNAVLLCKKLTMADATAPIPSCNAPSRAEAVPASDENGARESAEALGMISPCPERKRKTINVIPHLSYHPFITPANKIDPVSTCQMSAVKIIFSLSNFLRR